MMDIASRVTDDTWAIRIAAAETDHDAMGLAWSYLLASMRHADCSPTRLNELRRRFAVELIDMAQVEELR